MKSFLISALLVIGLFTLSCSANNQDYQSFSPIPIEEFYGGTNDLHLSLQLNCLKGKHLQKGSEFDPFWFPYCNLMKFVPSPYQQVDLSYYSGTTAEREKLYETFDKILDITIWLYKKAPNKDQFHQQLQAFFRTVEQSGSTQEIRRIAENMLRTVLGRAFIKSSIPFDEVWQTLQKEKREIFKTDAEPLGHFVPLDDFGRMPGGLLAVGDYLFSEDGGILKKWDTHWQPFITLELSDPEQYYNYENPQTLALSFANHTLHYTIPKDTDQEDHYLAAQYTLQQNARWKLSACFAWEEICPKNEECSLKQKKLPLKQCENFWVKMTTVLRR